MDVANRASSVDHYICTEITQFLGREAQLLDENRFAAWLALLEEDIVYEVPIRIVDNGDGKNEFPPQAYRMRDDLAMLKKRVERTMTGEAWSESPPSRTVRVVGSIVVEAAGESDTFLVHSGIIVYRQRAQEQIYDLIPARRRDVIRIRDGSCKLARRTIILAEAVLHTPNLGIFL